MPQFPLSGAALYHTNKPEVVEQRVMAVYFDKKDKRVVRIADYGLKDGKVFMVYGTPGGETIGQTEFQMLVNVIDFKLPVQQAVEFPRFALDAKPNFYKPGSEISITMENRVSEKARKALEAMGHKLNVTSDFTAAIGRSAGGVPLIA